MKISFLLFIFSMFIRWASYGFNRLVSTSFDHSHESLIKYLIIVSKRVPYFILFIIGLLLSGFIYSSYQILNGFNYYYYFIGVNIFLFIFIMIIVREVFSLKWKLKFYNEKNHEIVLQKISIFLKILIILYLSAVISGGYLFLRNENCILKSNLIFSIIHFLITFEEYTFCQSLDHKILIEYVYGISIFYIQILKGGSIQEIGQIIIEIVIILLILKESKTIREQPTKTKESISPSKLEKARAEFYNIVKVPLIIFDNKFNILEKNTAFNDLLEELNCQSEEVLFEKMISKDNISLKENIESSFDINLKSKNCKSIYYIKYPSECKFFYVVNLMDIIVHEDNIKYFHMSIAEITEEISNIRSYANESSIISIDSIAHEFNTPLNGIVGLLQALCKMTIGEVKNYIKIAKSCAIILSSQINSLTDTFKYRKGQFILHMSNFNFHILIEKIVKFASNFLLSKDSKVIISSEISQDVPSSISGDSERLRQIIFNLILNSSRHTKIGTIKIFASMQNFGELVIGVSDTGEGMSTELVNSINNKSRHKSSKKVPTSDQKLGFKLKTCQALLIEMNSKLFVKSCKGSGTTFSFSLPLYSNRVKRKNYTTGLIGGITFYEDSIDNDYTLSQKIAQYTHNTMGHTMLSIKRKFEPSKVISQGPFQKFKSPLSINLNVVLIVDDADLNRFVLHAICERFPNYEIVEAANGEEALIKAKTFEEQHRLKIIFMDVDMPIMNGIDCTIKIREFSKCLIVAVTSFTSDEVRSKCLNAGMNIFLTKPISYRDVKMLFSSL